LQHHNCASVGKPLDIVYTSEDVGAFAGYTNHTEKNENLAGYPPPSGCARLRFKATASWRRDVFSAAVLGAAP
jgi:hypothetical protein